MTGVGDLGAALLAAVPAEPGVWSSRTCRPSSAAIHEAFSVATSSTFLLGIGATAVAAGLVLLLREAPARGYETENESGEPGQIGEPTPGDVGDFPLPGAAGMNCSVPASRCPFRRATPAPSGLRA